MIKSAFLTLLLASSVAAASAASSAPNITLVTVHVRNVYKSYWKTVDHERKLRTDRDKVQGDIEELRKAGEGLVKQYEESAEQARNTALSEDARRRAAEDASRTGEQIRQKEEELQQFVQNHNQMMNIRQSNHQEMMLDEISRVVLEIGKARGATLIMDTSGPTGIGISGILYADQGYDITDQVITQLNKTKPTDFREEPAVPAAPSSR